LPQRKWPAPQRIEKGTRVQKSMTYLSQQIKNELNKNGSKPRLGAKRIFVPKDKAPLSDERGAEC
jgi:hypothetical protein